MQVEETLNNSNDLFLTFRKEMEEMSKKTKRLEKENQTLQRHKEVTNRNIGEMVEERQKWQEDLARKTKETEEDCPTRDAVSGYAGAGSGSGSHG
jgi:FtsZ-binding cell division protein ZapB